jgi:hypothetical protein
LSSSFYKQNYFLKICPQVLHRHHPGGSPGLAPCCSPHSPSCSWRPRRPRVPLPRLARTLFLPASCPLRQNHVQAVLRRLPRPRRQRPRPRSSGMPTWGSLFQSLDNYHRAPVDTRIRNLCDYLARLQEKQARRRIYTSAAFLLSVSLLVNSFDQPAATAPFFDILPSTLLDWSEDSCPRRLKIVGTG